MTLDALRWLLLLSAAAALLAILRRGASPGRLAVFAVCGLGWYVLSRRKMRSLDRGR